MYVTLTAVTINKNPIKKAKFWYFAIPLLLEAESKARYGETTGRNGKRLALTVWNDPQGAVEFISSEVPKRVLHKMAQNDVCTSTRFYSYQTDHLPNWEEAAQLLEVKGQRLPLS